MNKKILMLTLMLLATLTLAMVPVQAAPKAKLDFELYWEAPIITEFDPLGEGIPAPKKSGGFDYPIQKTFHGRGISQDILFANVTMGEVDYFEMDVNCTVTSVFDFEFNWHTMCATVKTKETITFAGIDGTIELSIIEKANYLTLSFEGTFVGHGTGELKGVKIVGTTSGYPTGWIEIESGVWVPTLVASIRVGTIMGW